MANDGDYAFPFTGCTIKGTAICHIHGKCSECVFAMSHEDPSKPLFFFLQDVKK